MTEVSTLCASKSKKSHACYSAIWQKYHTSKQIHVFIIKVEMSLSQSTIFKIWNEWNATWNKHNELSTKLTQVSNFLKSTSNITLYLQLLHPFNGLFSRKTGV